MSSCRWHETLLKTLTQSIESLRIGSSRRRLECSFMKLREVKTCRHTRLKIHLLYNILWFHFSKQKNNLMACLVELKLSSTTTDNCIKWYHRKKIVVFVWRKKVIPFLVLTHIALSRCRFCITRPAHRMWIQALKNP